MLGIDLKSRNIALIYGMKFLGKVVFFIPILALYFEEQLFTVTNVALIFSVRAIAQTVLEVPTGSLADILGRKKTLIISKACYIVALVFLALGGNIWMFLGFAVLDAFHKSLRSGTFTSLIYDTLREEGREDSFKKVSGTGSAISHAGIALGSVASGYLAAVSLSLPILLTFVPAVLALILAFFLHEPIYKREEEDVAAHLKEAAGSILNNGQLLIIAAGLVILSSSFEAIKSLNPLWYRFKDVPVQAFGWITAIIFGLASLGYYKAQEFAEWIGERNAVLSTVVIPPIAIFISTFLYRYLAVAVAIISPLFFGLRKPVIKHMVHEEAESGHRATVHSILELTSSLGIAAFTPLAGYLADLYTINTSFRITAVLLLAVPLLYVFLDYRD